MKQVDIVNSYKSGRRLYRSFNKNVTFTSAIGFSYDLSMSSGNPPAQYYVGGIAESTILSRTENGGIDTGGNTEGSKFIDYLVVQSPLAAANPATIEFMDYLMFYPFIGMDAGVTAMVNSVPLSRYESGAGVQIMVVEQNPYVGGAKIQITYTNQDGVAGRLTPITTINTSTVIGTVATKARNVLGCFGDFMPLQSGDSGVRSIDSIEIFGGDVGVLCLVLVKPIFYVNIYSNLVPNEYYLFQHLGFLPEVKNDAYLNILYKPSGNASGANISGGISTIWLE